MHSTLLIATALFSASAFAQANDFNIDTAEETKVIDEVSDYLTTLESSPAFQTDVADLVADLPSSVVQEAENNPDAFIEQLIDSPTLPAYVSAIPTSITESLETFVAEPIKAVEDVESYLSTLVQEPEVSSAVSVLMTAVPTSVQEAFGSNPVAFVENLITATALPSWIADIPAPLQSDIGSVVNKGLSIVAADFEGNAASATPAVPASVASSEAATSAVPVVPAPVDSSACSACPTCPGTVTVFQTVTNTAVAATAAAASTTVFSTTAAPPYASSGVVPSAVVASTGGAPAFNKTIPSSSPIAFEGAASSSKTVAVGAVALIASIGFLFAL
ncbi:hypothetical protein P7C71_g1067, partial [Lecanoromycetidae sp. Uapishka_2]